MRSLLLAVALGVSVVASAVADATAGSVTVTYGLPKGGSIGLSFPHVSPVFGGGWTVALKAYRSTPAASYGYIKGGSILSLFLSAYDYGAKAYQSWTVGLTKVGKGYPLPVPYLYGKFAGVTPAGSSFTPMGFFSAMGYASKGYVYVTHGFYGPGSVPGSGYVTVSGTAYGYGYGYECWNGFGAPGACTAFTPFAPPFSMSVPVVGPGFNVVGGEVARTVAVPEPSKTLLLASGLALLSLLSLAGWRRA